MSVWANVGLAEFKRKAKKGEIYLDSDASWDDMVKIKEILNNVVVWLTELEDLKEDKGKQYSNKNS